MTTKTRSEMEADYGSLPLLVTVGERYTWRICRAHADVTWTTDDGGDTWQQRGVIWAEQRARRDNEALEQHRIQVELK